jgi:hypothetical protein
MRQPVQGLRPSFDDVMPQPQFRKLYAFLASVGAGQWEGMMAGAVASAGTIGRNNDPTHGHSLTIATGTTLGTQAGSRCNHSPQVFIRAYNPTYLAKFKLETTTLQELYFGFRSSSSSFVVGEDPLNATNGFGLVMRSDDTNFQIAHNDASGATVFDDTGFPIDTGVHVIFLRAVESVPAFEWKLDGGQWNRVTTEIPSQTSGLNIEQAIRNNEAADKSMKLYWVYGQSEK